MKMLNLLLLLLLLTKMKTTDHSNHDMVFTKSNPLSSSLNITKPVLPESTSQKITTKPAMIFLTSLTKNGDTAAKITGGCAAILD